MKKTSSAIIHVTLLMNEYLEMIWERREEMIAYDNISSRSLNYQISTIS